MKISKNTTFHAAVQQISGFSFIYENLPLHSPLGRKKLMNSSFCTEKSVLNTEFDLLYEIVVKLQRSDLALLLEKLSKKLSSFHDILHTIENLKSAKVLDDIQLFEIKKFSILTEEVLDLLLDLNLSAIKLHSSVKVINLLDPEEKRIPHFYIYSDYSKELTEKRLQYSREHDLEKKEELFFEISQIEDEIRAKLSAELFPFSSLLSENSERIATLDLLLAKARQALKLGLVRPEITEYQTDLHELFHPEIKSSLLSQSKKYQPVDIVITSEPLLITGANMSGKTVLLKSISLAQTMLQFGFFIPAQRASMMLMEEIHLSIEEQISELSGLSSFATEILTIDSMIKTVKKNVKILAIVDELARTTNPEEGKRMVRAFVEIMEKYAIPAIVTTHYTGIETPVRRLRVAGLRIDDDTEITPNTINNYMDYSLIEVVDDDVPEEAIRIAKFLGVDEEFLQKAEQ